jgi:broad specificity polyphosphatase/5'/3'-nucleotidase SurE
MPSIPLTKRVSTGQPPGVWRITKFTLFSTQSTEKDLLKVNIPHVSIEEDAATLRIAPATIIVITPSLRTSEKLPVLL